MMEYMPENWVTLVIAFAGFVAGFWIRGRVDNV